jgi:rhodanese-related sulfurtransferase
MQVRLGCLPGTYENGETVADVLSYNHYGTKTIPPRPVLRMAAEKLVSTAKMKKHLKAFSDNFVKYAKRGRKGDMKEAEIKMLTALGQQSVATAKRIIDAGGKLQHNAPATVAKKGAGKPPLRDTGLLEKKLGYEVVE